MSDSDNGERTRTDAGEACECCGLGSGASDAGRGPDRQRDDADRWLDGSDPLDATLPADLQSALGEFVGRDSVETLGALADEIREFTGGGAIAVADLCHAGDETAHWGAVDGERYHFQCFYDAVILAAIEDRPVDIHTESPDGRVVEAKAVGDDELSVTPESAVFSFGIDPGPGDRSGGSVSVEDGYSAICPYVKAFPDREAYEQWTTSTAAPTVAMPLAGATDLAGALVS